MKYIPYIIFVFIIACSSGPKKSDISINNIIADSNIIDTISVIENVMCDCDTFKSTWKYTFDLTIRGKEDILNNEEFKKWSSDSLRLKVKSIKIARFDTIPQELAVFENVERLYIDMIDGDIHLDLFPKLRFLEFFGSVVNINENEKWVSNIESFRVWKSRIRGISSLSVFSKLKEFYIIHARLIDCKMDFESLSCIQILIMNAWMGDDIDFGLINLENNDCLKHLEIVESNACKGVPRGLENKELSTVRIRTYDMSQEDKDLVELYKRNTQ